MPSRKRKKRTPLGPAWLADMVRVFHGWQLALPLAIGAWMWRHWRGVGSVVLAGLLFVWTGEPVLAGMGLFTVYGAVLFWRWKRPAKRARWWDQATLSEAFVDSGVLKKDGKLTLSYRGKPIHSELGTSVTVGLPQARSLADVMSRQDSLAAALRVPAKQLSITQSEDDPANVIKIYVGTGARAAVPTTIATATATEWATPVRIGFDSRGESVHLATFEHNSLIAGRPGAGKSTLVKLLLGHYLLDPSTAVYLLDGKGAVKDYGAARKMCTAFVSGVDDDGVAETLSMLEAVLFLVRARNADGGEHHGVLVLLEEFQDIRAAATKPQREQLDSTLGRIVRMGRAVGVHVVVSTQRPTVEDLPSGTRNLLSQRVALMLRNSEDAKLVLGTAPPTAKLPSRRGQALFTDGGPIGAIELDRLTDVAWKKVCNRAAVLRESGGDDAPPPPPDRVEVTEEEEEEESGDLAPPNPILAAVLDVLAAGDRRGVSATELYDKMPDWVRLECPTPRSLGVLLGCYPRWVVRGWIGDGRAWRACPGVLTSGPEETLVDEVVAILTKQPRGLTATELHAQLSPGALLEVPTPHNLGLLLARHSTRVERVRAGNGSVWRRLAVGTGHSRSEEPVPDLRLVKNVGATDKPTVGLPETPGYYLYKLYGFSGELLYVGVTYLISRRLPEHVRSKPWWSDVASHEITAYPDHGRLLRAESLAIRTENPKYNVAGQARA